MKFSFCWGFFVFVCFIFDVAIKGVLHRWVRLKRINPCKKKKCKKKEEEKTKKKVLYIFSIVVVYSRSRTDCFFVCLCWVFFLFFSQRIKLCPSVLPLTSSFLGLFVVFGRFFFFFFWCTCACFKEPFWGTKPKMLPYVCGQTDGQRDRVLGS